jgi:hypothetical protein
MCLARGQMVNVMCYVIGMDLKIAGSLSFRKLKNEMPLGFIFGQSLTKT